MTSLRVSFFVGDFSPTTNCQTGFQVRIIKYISNLIFSCFGLKKSPFSFGSHFNNFFPAVAIAHGLMEQTELKTSLLYVQLSTAAGKNPTLLMEHCVTILQHSDHVQTGIGLLMLLSAWLVSFFS
jgi:hypothetical protein